MKRMAIVFGILCLGVFTMFIERDKKKSKKFFKINTPGEDEITGPHGEPVLIGSHGGRYYLKGDKKVYLKHKDD